MYLLLQPIFPIHRLPLPLSYAIPPFPPPPAHLASRTILACLASVLLATGVLAPCSFYNRLATAFSSFSFSVACAAVVRFLCLPRYRCRHLYLYVLVPRHWLRCSHRACRCFLPHLRHRLDHHR